MEKVFVYDPTLKDQKSAVRGIGRYLQILKENFSDKFKFVSDLTNRSVTTDPYNIFINPFFNFLQRPVTIKRIAQKQIAVIHDLIPLKYPAHFPAGIKGNINIGLNKYALRNYDVIVTDSEASKKDIIDILRLPDSKIKVIYPCLTKIFTDRKSEIRNPKSETITKIQKSNNKNVSDFKHSDLEFISNFDIRASSFCLYVGDATWNKNLVNLAKAIKIANVNCVFVGKVFDRTTGVETSGILAAWRRPFGSRTPTGKKARQAPSLDHSWQKELKKFYELTKDDQRFIFKGFVTDGELIKLYQQAVVNILPSRDEGFGFSYLEAASQHCPSVLADIPVLREISAGNTIYANPDDPADLAKKINEIYFNKELRQTLGQQAFKQSQKFSSYTFKKQFLAIIQ